MRKRILAILLVLAMVMGSFVGCADKKEPADDTTVKTDEAADTKEDTEEAEPTEAAAADDAEEAVPTPTMMPNELIGDPNVENPFYIYGWNTEISTNIIKYFAEVYPEDAKRIVFVNTGGTPNYQIKLDALLADPSNEQYPDLFAMEMDYIMKYTDSDFTLPVADLGVTDADMANMYEYTIQAATVDGVVKGISWQSAPGAMMYRRSLAEKYLGVSEPADVQPFFKDWATMLETGKTIKEKSAGVTKLFSGIDDVKRVYQAGRKEAWYDADSKIVVDPVMQEYMDYAKQLYDLELTNNTAQWSTEWASNTATDNTFAYMGCTWFLHYVLKPNSGGTKPGEGTYGDWGMIMGPQPYYWGGTWLGASKECSDKELAGKIMKAICDKDIMKAICTGTSDYVNHKEAIAELSAEGKGVFDFLSGQDFLTFFTEMAAKITLPAMCGEDLYLTNAFDAQVIQFTSGDKDKETAIADFKSSVVDIYPYLTAE